MDAQHFITSMRLWAEKHKNEPESIVAGLPSRIEMANRLAVLAPKVTPRRPGDASKESAR